jgi:tetratricopeptide (TPR) repeat protein
MQPRLRNLCILVAVAAALPYLLLPSQPIVYDGERAITANEALRTGPLTDLFALDFWGEPTRAEHGTRSWRPLVTLSWAMQIRTLGESTAMIHAADVLLHAGASVLLLLLLAAWGIGRRWLLPAGLLFALHPVQTDAVASTVGRADVMAAICLFGALLLQSRAPGSARPFLFRAGALLCVAAGLMCKEYAVSFPFVLVATDLIRRAGDSGRAADRRAEIATWAASFALLALYLFMRVWLFGSLGGASIGPDLHPLAGQSLDVRWATSLAMIPLALRLLLVPVALNHHYRFGTIAIPEGLLDWKALAGLLLLAILVACAASAIKRRRTAPALAVVLFLLPLGPSLHVVSVVGVLFAERFLYIPAAGVALAFGWALERWISSSGSRRLATPILALLLVSFALLAFDRVRDWSSAESLARSSIASYPNGAGAWKQLGLAQLRDGRPEEALAALERAKTINPRDAQAWIVYAQALKELHRYHDAADALHEVIALAPSEPGVVLREVGQVELLAGHAHEAIAPLLRAHELMPADALTLYALAQAYLRTGKVEDAVAVLEAGEEAMRTDPEALGSLLDQARSAAGR